MADESTSSPKFMLGRVFAVLRKWKPIKQRSSCTAATALISKSMSLLAIGSTHVVAAAQPPDATSRDDSCSLGFQEDLRAAFTIVAPILDAVPIAGPPLKAAVGGLLEILKAADTITRNREDIKKLEEKLRRLDDDIFMVPGTSKQRDDLTRQLNVTLTKLKGLQRKRVFQYSTVSQIIKECSTDIDHYVWYCTMLDGMHTRAMVEAFVAFVPQPMISKMTGIVLIDATGKRRDVSMDCAKSYEIFTKIIAHFFDGNKMEARIQRRYIEQGRYDLCIDQGTEIVQINGERDWSKVEPGMQVVMRAILVREKGNRHLKYQCPRCKAWNESKGESRDHGQYVIIDCLGCDGRFQISKADANYTEDRHKRNISENAQDTSYDAELGVLVNFHLKEYNVPRRLQALPTGMMLATDPRAIRMMRAAGMMPAGVMRTRDDDSDSDDSDDIPREERRVIKPIPKRFIARTKHASGSVS